jgi:hypothetical protein
MYDRTGRLGYGGLTHKAASEGVGKESRDRTVQDSESRKAEKVFSDCGQRRSVVTSVMT